MLNFTDVSLRRGTRVLVSEATFSLFRGEKVGITGENGSGKSTLLALVRGEVHPETGSFDMPSNLEVAHVSQELLPSDQPAIEFVLDGDPGLRELEARIAVAESRDEGERLANLYADYGAIGGYDARSRAAKLLHGLGFTSADEERPVRAFSGGWRVRLNVAKALMCRSDLLLLDEPTNHLDIDAILWLEEWLRAYPGTLLLIAHDREFLDRVVNRIVNIEHGHARAYRGNYSAFEDQRASELAEQAALFARQQREIRHMESFVERFRAKASKARQAQSRLKALERMQRIAPAHVDSPFEFSFAEPAKLPRPLLAIENQSVGYEGHAILDGVKLTLSPGDRVALLGRNGAGKSTLMKLLAGELQALSGTRTEARDLRIGYFAQHQLEQIVPIDSALANLRRVEAELSTRAAEQDLRDYLAGYGFRGNRVFEPVAPFSGGEKARLALALVAFRRPNLLLLDEPTNHLDLEMRQALAVALQDYTGAVVVVSHDRHLLRTVADELYIVDSGSARIFDGDLDDYAKWLARGGRSEPAAQASLSQPASEQKTARTAKRSAGGAPTRPAGANAVGSSKGPGPRRANPSSLQATLARCERELEALTQENEAITKSLAGGEVYESSRRAELEKLLARQAELAQAIAVVESEWLEASERLEAAG